MTIKDLEIYRCPFTHSRLTLSDAIIEDDKIFSGKLINNSGFEFQIKDFIPDFTWTKEHSEADYLTRTLYDKLAEHYEQFALIPFKTFKQDNVAFRESVTQKLNLKSNSKVLETGGGDGRGAEFILKYIPEGKLYFQELSRAFLNVAEQRLKLFRASIEFSVGNGSYLPFPDNYFDAAHHFGGINTFAEKHRCFQELVRVVKPSGKIVIGDEGIGPWLRDTTFAKIMINSNPLIGYEVPLSCIPVDARNVKLEWVLMGAYYIIEFEVGEGAPEPDYHVNIPGERGGSHWTRYYGNLEGVSDEVKQMAQKEREKSGLSMHAWLEKIIRQAITKDDV